MTEPCPEPPRRRILFVDDEPQVLDGLRSLLRKQRPLWDMEFATGGLAALAAFERAPFDVVVADARMPELDGTELLTLVRDRYPATARIMLSGHAERDAIARAMVVSHQFLSKPCDAALLKQVIARVCGLHQLLHTVELRRMVGRVDNLPSVPALYTELVAALARPNTTTGGLAEIVGRDPAMAAKILQLVNSSYFGLPRPLGSIERAVAYLGSDLLRSLALTVGIFARASHAPVPGFSSADLQERAVLGARLARGFLAADPEQASHAFAAALVRDIGKLLLLVGAPDYPAVLAASAGHCDATGHERAAYGVDHAALGAYLLGVWGLPPWLVEAVAFHHEPERIDHDDREVALAVHVAAIMADAATRRRSFELRDAVRDALGNRLPRWRRQADELLHAAGYTLEAAR